MVTINALKSCITTDVAEVHSVRMNVYAVFDVLHLPLSSYDILQVQLDLFSLTRRDYWY